MDQRPIGIFDSGLGGLTAVRRLRRVLPGEDIVFLGDTGRVPYGGRSPDTIRRYAKEDVDFLLARGVKAVLAACGTVSSVCPEALEGRGVPACGVVEPAAARAAGITARSRILVTCTEAAARAGAYAAALRRLEPGIEVLTLPCPRFVPLIEGGVTAPEAPELRAAVEETLAPALDFGADTLILGCTHYPLIAEAIRRFVGEQVRLVDAAAEAAEELKRKLAERSLLSGRGEGGGLLFCITGSAGSFASRAGRFLPGPETMRFRHYPPGERGE